MSSAVLSKITTTLSNPTPTEASKRFLICLIISFKMFSHLFDSATLSDTSTSEANSFIQTLRDINGTTNSTEISILSSKEISNTTTTSSVPTSLEISKFLILFFIPLIYFKFLATFNGTSTTKISSSIQTTSEPGKFFSAIFVTSYGFSRKLILSVSCWQCYDTFRQFRNNHIVICSAFKNNNNTFESYSNRSK
jgi:hypothetical protein